MPDEKVEALKEICEGETAKSLYVGDSINDGPVLVTSETGIAMGRFGSQVAVEVADAVILDDSPMKVVELLSIARKTRTIIWQNVFMALGVKGIFLIGGAAGIAGLWEAVFADVGVALLAILNATRASKSLAKHKKRRQASRMTEVCRLLFIPPLPFRTRRGNTL